MSAIKDGGPAFPAGSIRKSRPAHDPGADFHVTDVAQPANAGMTLRDYFAAKAMHAVMTGKDWNHVRTPEEIAKVAYLIADAMLAAREAKS